MLRSTFSATATCRMVGIWSPGRHQAGAHGPQELLAQLHIDRDPGVPQPQRGQYLSLCMHTLIQYTQGSACQTGDLRRRARARVRRWDIGARRRAGAARGTAGRASALPAWRAGSEPQRALFHQMPGEGGDHGGGGNCDRDIDPPVPAPGRQRHEGLLDHGAVEDRCRRNSPRPSGCRSSERSSGRRKRWRRIPAGQRRRVPRGCRRGPGAATRLATPHDHFQAMRSR